MAKKGRTKGNKICPAGIAWAKRTFDTYPSAYANMAASKYCKDPNYAKGSKKKQMSLLSPGSKHRKPINAANRDKMKKLELERQERARQRAREALDKLMQRN